MRMKTDIGAMHLQAKAPRMVREPPEAQRGAWNRRSHTALRRKQSCRHLDLGLLAYRL